MYQSGRLTPPSGALARLPKIFNEKRPLPYQYLSSLRRPFLPQLLSLPQNLNQPVALTFCRLGIYETAVHHQPARHFQQLHQPTCATISKLCAQTGSLSYELALLLPTVGGANGRLNPPTSSPPRQTLPENPALS